MAITATERTQIVELAVLMFNAAPGATYLSQLVSMYEANGHNLQALAVTLGSTPAYQTLNPNFQLASDFATAFLTPLGLQADSVAVAFVTSKFNAGESKGQIAFEAFTALNGITSANGVQYQNAKAILLNKTAVAEYYSEVKAVAETNIGALQNVLSTITADPATVTAEIAALNVVPPQTFNLTTGVDVVHAEVAPNSIVTGTADVAGTFTTGDIVTGNATTVFNLSLNGTPTSLSTVTNVGTVNLNADASTIVNADLWSGIGSINVVTPSIAGMTTTISNAQVATIIGDSSGNATNVTVTYRDTSGSADTAHIALGGTGTSTTASVIDVSSGNTVEGLAIVTSGTDIATINGGTKDKLITISGTGADTFSFGATAATLTVDASATTASQKLTFVAGSIGSEDTITGGTGADTVTANSSTSFAHMTGVENFVTTVDGGVGLYDGANVSGLTTMTINQGSAAGSELFTNMKGEFTTLTINGPTVTQEVDYNTGAAATLTVNYGHAGATAFDTVFDGLAVKNVANLTVNLDVADVAPGATTYVGTVTLDKNVTNNFTLNQNGSDDYAYLTIDRADSLQHLSITAAGDNSTMSASVTFAHNQAVQGLNSLTLTASGIGSDLEFDSWAYSGGSNYMALDTFSLVASGQSSTAHVHTYIYSTGDMTSFNITASGDSSDAHMYETASTYGNVGSFNITASGNSASASLDAEFNVYSGNLGSINIVASGNYAYAEQNSYIDVYSGDVGTVNVIASGTSSYAYEDYLWVSGNIGDINVTASGATASAYMYLYSVYGDISSINITSSGAASTAWFSADYQITGDVGAINVVASGDTGYAYFYEAGGISGDVGPVTVTASGQSSTASLDFMYASGNMGAVKVTASGANSYAYDDAYVEGNVQSLAVTASGSGSSAYAYLHNYVDQSMTVASATIAATGAGATAYASIITGTAGVLGNVTISATKANTTASLYFTGNTFGSITATSGSPSADITLYVNNQTTSGGTITASGSGTLDLTIAGKSITSLNASGETNAVTVTVPTPATTSAGMTLTTGSFADHVQGGSGVDTFNLGAGADTFDFSNLPASGTVPSAVTDIIAGGFASGTDHLFFGTGVGSATDYTEVLTAAASLSAFITAADTALNGTVKYYFGVVGTDGYLATDADGTGITNVIKIVGVTDMAFGDISG